MFKDIKECNKSQRMKNRSGMDSSVENIPRVIFLNAFNCRIQLWIAYAFTRYTVQIGNYLRLWV
jgi:hypothetical protein